ncbi:hypothetical protein Pmar_PMAR021100 [Perkinsus marinus ATCC 50983]|uniref:Uncharacterized protein n=1 Tax=Perkinsus marinus (strain ATCC 50983 / TXsc) TaxID=423536 RepID=C5KGE5_PERM5|nr:hypothetical protein Pmar_PMAR021100 [Perkinsus marinus ATCC 50983]EER16501.1 hypothetical protein Pmar_PMAR021100 [Perkinsus marinus ATCC 50983]|eukprot:XP_002784705.1 hypothetical protein Pmar_PMAR021100 [Perkinsus marinus ATCC 50983]
MEEETSTTDVLTGVEVPTSNGDTSETEETRGKMTDLVEFKRLSIMPQCSTDRTLGFLTEPVVSDPAAGSQLPWADPDEFFLSQEQSRVARMCLDEPFIIALCHASLDDLNIPLHASLVCPESEISSSR